MIPARAARAHPASVRSQLASLSKTTRTLLAQGKYTSLAIVLLEKQHNQGQLFLSVSVCIFGPEPYVAAQFIAPAERRQTTDTHATRVARHPAGRNELLVRIGNP